MKRSTTAIGVALLGALPLLSSFGCDENILDPMADRQPRAHAYKESVFFADGLSMRPAPEGTVPRERITEKSVLTTGREGETGQIAPNGERVPSYAQKLPLPVTRKLLELGRKRFDITCATCHGPLGDGNSIVATQMSLRPPPSLHKYNEKPPGYIFEVISKGFGLMASYAAELTIEERWAVVAYVRALQVSQAATLDRAPPDVRARLEAMPAVAPPPARGGFQGERPGATDTDHKEAP
jgi:Cytochrome C oxidase, cbb3-type, subunit III